MVPNPADVPAHITTDFRPPEELIKRTDLVISQLYEWHRTANPNYPLFVYQDGDELQYITYTTANRAMDRAARYVASKVGCGGKEAAPVQPIVALLANTGTFVFSLPPKRPRHQGTQRGLTDTITYFTTAIGIMRAGCTLFLVSTRNAPAAIADMLQRTGAIHIIVSGDSFMQGIADEALAILSASGVHVAQHAMPTFEDIYSDELDPQSPFAVEVELPQKFHIKAHGIILHSSGWLSCN